MPKILLLLSKHPCKYFELILAIKVLKKWNCFLTPAMTVINACDCNCILHLSALRRFNACEMLCIAHSNGMCFCLDIPFLLSLSLSLCISFSWVFHFSNFRPIQSSCFLTRTLFTRRHQQSVRFQSRHLRISSLSRSNFLELFNKQEYPNTLKLIPGRKAITPPWISKVKTLTITWPRIREFTLLYGQNH